MTADLGAIRARLAAATPGPWKVYQSIQADTFVYGPRGFLRDDVIAGPTYERENADLIAHAPADLAALCDEVEALQAAVQRVRALHVYRPASGSIWAGCAECCAHFPCPTLRALGGAE